MLVLSRHESEEILLPSVGIKLKVVSIRGNVVRLGIEAPAEVRILRGELNEQIEQVSDGKVTGDTPILANETTVVRSQPLARMVNKFRKSSTRQPAANPSVASGCEYEGERKAPIIRESAARYEVCT